MKIAAKKLEFEKAAKIRGQLFALKHIQDVALIVEDSLNPSAEGGSASGGKSYILNPSYRIEGYDISNISGTSAVGSMVVFVGGEPAKSEYRKFKIRTVAQSDDVGMLKEVLRRRFARRPESGGWTLPNLILVDGGRGQVNAARAVLHDYGLKIPILGIAKGPTRKKNEFIGRIPVRVPRKTLIAVRDEAHRFAVRYHRALRERTSMRG